MVYISGSQPVVHVPLVVLEPPSDGTQKSLPKKKKKYITGVKYYYTTGSSSDQTIRSNRLCSRAEMSMTAHLAVNRRFENGLITLEISSVVQLIRQTDGVSAAAALLQ